MKARCFFIFVVMVLFCPILGQAQETQSLHELRPDLDVKEMKAQLAETNLNVQKSDQGKKEATATLIEAYENIVPELCAPNFARTLSYDPPSTDPFCLKYNQRLLALVPESSVGICARDGFAAASCQTSTKSIQFKDFSLDYEAKSEASRDVEYQLQVSRALPEIDKARSEFVKVETEYNVTHDQLKLPPLLAPLKRWIQLSCSSLRVRYYPPSPYRVLTVANPTPTSLSDRLQRQLDALAHGKQDKKVEQKQTGNTPFRLVSGQCVESLKRAETLFPSMALPTCYRVGFFSPDCVAAIKKERTTPLAPGTPLLPGDHGAVVPHPGDSPSYKPEFTTF